MNKLSLIKVGGKVVEDPQALDALLRDFSAIQGYKILVHGGGSILSRLACRMGIETRMHNGRRITDEATLELVAMVYGGLLNKRIVAKLQSLGLNGIGLSGADMNIIRSVKRAAGEVDYGFVGDVEEVAADALAALLMQGTVPVLAPLTHDGRGLLLNTNADTIAASVAKSMAGRFEVELVYCFEKPGVLADEADLGSLIPSLDREKFAELVAAKVIQGGMIAKLENAFDAIAAGVRYVRITQASALTAQSGTLIR
ncbi:MAG: acetylglutamate kinase [Tannerellaceae bacterium]|jgi:acetylglutamate kinase|nr:acetylglutamate kinase [Tannerellaceae bacterium]